MDNNEYIKEINLSLTKIANKNYSKKQSKYMRNKFEFFGTKANERRKAVNKYKSKNNRPKYENINQIIKELWEKDEREFQYFAMELLEKYSKEFEEEIIILLEYMIKNKSWWDTIDRISKKLVGKYFEKFPKNKNDIIEKWINSGNIWLQRTTILFQLAYKEDTDVDLLFNIIKRLKDIDEFFIQKAIGWALREYSKTDPKAVKKFIENNTLSNLSKREGSKFINKEGI
ncbi:MAG: DNA alkylation repair protein [Bacillota bacterium]